MEGFLRAGSLKVASISGIPIRVHFSWLIIFGIISWSLSTFYFPDAAPRLPMATYWVTGIIASFILFLSVMLHELAHSFVAIRYNLSIVNITLFIFGGVAQMRGEPNQPSAEVKIALAGPLTSFFLAFVFLAAYQLLENQILKAFFQYLSRVNFILGVFNLIPGFPMDGGRIIRAYLWNRTGDFFHATRKASNYGQKVAFFFILVGLVLVFAGFANGLWLMILGWFLYSAAQSSYQQASLQETLSGVKVKDIMVRDIIFMSPEITVEEAVYEYFLRYGFGGFPVMSNGNVYGFVTLKEVKDVPREKWSELKVEDIYRPHEQRLEISMEDPAIKALELMINEDAGRLIVRDDKKIVGLITRNGIAQYVQIMGKS
ncbi:MAG: site-2 protease family protein [Thermodesulfovibrionales bacterium]|nr:site-2 protease family protein [Thermodesulfovibrionales bacterium]